MASREERIRLVTAVPFLTQAADVFAASAESRYLDEADALYQMAYERVQCVYGDEHIQCVAILIKQAAVTTDRGKRATRYEFAAKNAERLNDWALASTALNGAVTALMPADPSAVTPSAQLIAALRKLVEVDSLHYGKDDETHTLANVQRLATLAARAGGHAVSYESWLRLFDTWTRLHGVAADRTMLAMAKVLSALRQQECFVEALSFAMDVPERVAAIRACATPNAHMAAYELSYVMCKLKMFAEAEVLLVAALANANPTRANGVSDAIYNIVFALAFVSERIDKNAEAEDLYRWCWIEMSLERGADHRSTLSVMIEVARQMYYQDKSDDDTLAWMFEAKKRYTTAGMQDEMPFAHLCAIIGRTLSDRGQYDDAERQLIVAIEYLKRALPRADANNHVGGWLARAYGDVAWVKRKCCDLMSARQLYTLAREAAVAAKDSIYTRTVDEDILAVTEKMAKRAVGEDAAVSEAKRVAVVAPTPAAPPASSSSTNTIECVACLSAPREVFYGCGHVAVCRECDKKPITICPMCRVPVTERRRAYV